MPGSSLLALLDDIATVLDDVALLTKVAAKKTSGVLGDDLALNAEQVAGVRAERELPVVWAVAKGSAVNKAILVPAALAISTVTPWAVTPLLMVGGAFLCFEGFEKIAHKVLHSHDDAAREEELREALSDPKVDLVELEKSKIKGAIRTDFVLSAEIITITLGTVAKSTLLTRVIVLTGIGVLMTIGVYGLVAIIVKLDDGGLYLAKLKGDGIHLAVLRGLGRGVLKMAPYLMKLLSVAGTVAMFLVGGGILTHGLPAVHHAIEGVARRVGAGGGVGRALAVVTPALLDGLFGVAVGALVLVVLALAKRIFRRSSKA